MVSIQVKNTGALPSDFSLGLVIFYKVGVWKSLFAVFLTFRFLSANNWLCESQWEDLHQQNKFFQMSLSYCFHFCVLLVCCLWPYLHFFDVRLIDLKYSANVSLVLALEISRNFVWCKIFQASIWSILTNLQMMPLRCLGNEVYN